MGPAWVALDRKSSLTQLKPAAVWSLRAYCLRSVGRVLAKVPILAAFAIVDAREVERNPYSCCDLWSERGSVQVHTGRQSQIYVAIPKGFTEGSMKRRRFGHQIQGILWKYLPPKQRRQFRQKSLISLLSMAFGARQLL